MRHGRREGGATVVAALMGMCVLAGCSSSPGAAAGRSTASASRSTTAHDDIRVRLDHHNPQLHIGGAHHVSRRVGRLRAGASRREPRGPATGRDDGGPPAAEREGEHPGRSTPGDGGARTFKLHPKVTAMSTTSATAAGAAPRQPRITHPEQLLHQAWDESADPFIRAVYVTIARLKRDNRV